MFLGNMARGTSPLCKKGFWNVSILDFSQGLKVFYLAESLTFSRTDLGAFAWLVKELLPFSE